MQKPFCRLLKNQYRFEYGELSPCCWITKRGDLQDPKKTKEYIEWMHSIDDWVPECGYCHDLEKRGIESGRMRSTKRPEVYGFNDSDQPGDAVAVEFQLDIDCNAACIMCSSQNSTTWQKYDAGSGKDKKIHIDIVNKTEVSNRLDDVKNAITFDKVNLATFLGGEPLKVDTHIKILYEILKAKDPSTVTLRYISNGSIKPSQEVFDLWSKFKRVELNISLDATEDHFHYIRWPLKFDQVKDNLTFILDQKLPNLMMYTSYCINPFNMFYHDRYVEWAKVFVRKYRGRAEFYKRPFEVTGIINLECVPPKLAGEIKQRYREDYPEIVSLMMPFNLKKFMEFMEYIEQHDEKRGISYKEIFPEVAPYFTEMQEVGKKLLDRVI